MIFKTRDEIIDIAKSFGGTFRGAEKYGRKSYAYMAFSDLDERESFEQELQQLEVWVSPTYCKAKGNCKRDYPISEIRIKTFKGIFAGD